MDDLEDKVSGYCTITYRLRLYTNHLEKIKLTTKLYNEIILFYYKLLLDNQDFLNLSNQYCLRELEKLTVKSRDGKKPEFYIEEDLPVYFRRAAINQAIGAVRSYISRYKNYINNDDNLQVTETKKFNSSMLFYKGMYKNFENNSIYLKLWDGEKWDWYKNKVKEIPFKSDVEILSPTIVLNSKYVMLHVPVKEKIEDVRPVKLRMQDENLKVMGVSFSNLDSFAICACLRKDGTFCKSKFIKGGNEYREKTNQILLTIKKHRRVNSKLTEKDHKNYWDKLRRIDDYYAHKVSKEIIDFAKENDVEVISIAKIEDDVKGFTRRVGKHSPIYLRRKIVEYLKYKAFKNSIMITTVRQNYTASKCNICRENVKKVGQEFTCPNGHAGNYYLNTAMNIGKMCLKKFGLII